MKSQPHILQLLKYIVDILTLKVSIVNLHSYGLIHSTDMLLFVKQIDLLPLTSTLYQHAQFPNQQ